MQPPRQARRCLLAALSARLRHISLRREDFGGGRVQLPCLNREAPIAGRPNLPSIARHESMCNTAPVSVSGLNCNPASDTARITSLGARPCQEGSMRLSLDS